MNIKKILGAVLLISVITVPALSQSIDDALRTAKSENKKVLLIFYSLNDSWSQKLDKEVLTYQEAIGQMVNFVVVRIDGDSKSGIQYDGKSVNAKELASAFSVTGYPSFVFLNPDGTPVMFRYDGESVKSISGYLDAGDFVKMLKYFSQNKQNDSDLSDELGS